MKTRVETDYPRGPRCPFRWTKQRGLWERDCDRYFKFLEAAQKGENPLYERYIRRTSHSFGSVELANQITALRMRMA